MTSRPLTLLFPALLVCCAVQPTAPLPHAGQTIAVMPPSNQTGDPLLVSGTSLLEQYAFDTPRATVGDVLAAELGLRLRRRGFTVVADDVVRAATEGRGTGNPEAAAELARHAHLTEPLLVVAIDRWEPDGDTHPDFVIVALEAWLVDPGTGAVRWHTHRRANPISTPGSVTLASGYQIAAGKAAEELVEGLAAAP